MTLPRDEVVPGLVAELGEFEALVRSLDEIEWKAPSRCDDWTAGDVAGHVIGQLADITAGRFDGLGTPEVTARQVEERRGRTPAELADELAQVLTEQGYAPATLQLDGLEPFSVSGGGPTITGAPEQFVLVATGRMAPESLGLDATINVFR